MVVQSAHLCITVLNAPKFYEAPEQDSGGHLENVLHGCIVFREFNEFSNKERPFPAFNSSGPLEIELRELKIIYF